MSRLKKLVALLWLSSSVSFAQVDAHTRSTTHTGQTIVSPTHPKDSRGETVYESQGSTHKDQPVVPGVLVQPSAIKLPDPKYPKSLRKARADADVTVVGVVTESGDCIDATVTDPVDPNLEIKKSALDAVEQYKFKPATLDGKPVAVLVRLIIRFRVR